MKAISSLGVRSPWCTLCILLIVKAYCSTLIEMTLLAANIKAMAKKFALQCNTIYQIGIVFDRSYSGMAAELPLLEC